MINTHFESIIDLFDAFKGDQACIEYLEETLWEDGVVSPFYPEGELGKDGEPKYIRTICKTKLEQYEKGIIKNKEEIYFDLKHYYCLTSQKYFNVKNSTVFHGTKLPLRKFFGIIWLMMGKKNISGQSVADQLGIKTQTTAFYIMKKIKNCLASENDTKLDGTIEVDESFIGGKEHNKHNIKKLKNTQGRSLEGKEAVFGAVQRATDGTPVKVNLKHMPDITQVTLTNQILQWVEPFATICSDEYGGYSDLRRFDYMHFTINHSWRQYVKGRCHTNTIEGIWSLFKRNIIGIHHHISPKYLQMYLNWFVFKLNTKDYTIRQRFDLVLKNMSNKITYTELVHG